MKILSLEAVPSDFSRSPFHVDFTVEENYFSEKSADAESAARALRLVLFGPSDQDGDAEFKSVRAALESSEGIFDAEWNGSEAVLTKKDDASAKWKISQLTNISSEDFFSAIFLDAKHWNHKLSASDGIFAFGSCLSAPNTDTQRLQLAAEGIVKQKEAMLQASEKVIASIPAVSQEEEQNLSQMLVRTEQELAALQRDVQKNQSQIKWIEKIALLKEEISKLSKQKAVVDADIARFRVKQTVLEKARKADKLQPEYDVIVQQREHEKEIQKELSDLKKTTPFLSEKVRSAVAALNEADKNYQLSLNEFHEKRAIVERVRTLDEDISSFSIEQKNTKDSLVREQTALRLIQENVNRLKALLSRANMREQLLAKKMNEQSSDSLLVSELDEYEKELQIIEDENSNIEKFQEDQRKLQKTIELNRSQLTATQAALSQQKAKELSLQSELTTKKRILIKTIGHDSPESLHALLAEREAHLAKVNEMVERISLLAMDHEEQVKEKELLEGTKHALRISSLSLSAAIQTLRDKQALVEATSSAHAFYLQVLSYEKARSELINGKPCPLCGAIHHPYASGLHFDTNTAEKLKKAKAEAAAAKQTKESLEADHLALQQSLNEHETRLSDLTKKLESEKDFILSETAELGLTGLREKKPIVWGPLVRQKQTALVNRRDDLKTRLEKIDSGLEQIAALEGALSETSEELRKLRQSCDSLELTIKNDSDSLQQLYKKEKESELARVNTTRLLERTFARYGLKASTPAMQKQNFPTLVKRREQWLAWSSEHEELSAAIAKDAEQLRSENELHTVQKKTVGDIETNLEAIAEKLKKLQKDRHEAIANHSPDEFIGAIESECENAKRLKDEAQTVYEARQNALNENQEKIDSLEGERNEIQLKVAELSANFVLNLNKYGFPNEVTFLSSAISSTQLSELERQSTELSERLKTYETQLDQKKEELAGLEKLELTHLTRSQLDEILNQKSDQFHVVSGQAAVLREKVASNLNNRNRRRREEKESTSLSEQIQGWKSLIGTSEHPENPVELARKLLVQFANEYLGLLEAGFKLRFQGSSLLVKTSSTLNGPTISPISALSEQERSRLAMALQLARTQLIAPQAITEGFVLVKSSSENKSAYRDIADKLSANNIRLLVS